MAWVLAPPRGPLSPALCRRVGIAGGRRPRGPKRLQGVIPGGGRGHRPGCVLDSLCNLGQAPEHNQTKLSGEIRAEGTLEPSPLLGRGALPMPGGPLSPALTPSPGPRVLEVSLSLFPQSSPPPSLSPGCSSYRRPPTPPGGHWAGRGQVGIQVQP